MEKDYEKINRAMQLRREYASRVAAVEQEIQIQKSKMSTEEQVDRADEWLSKRLDAGFYSLQTADMILAWLVAEDEGARTRIGSLLGDRDEGFEVLRATLKGIVSAHDLVITIRADAMIYRAIRFYGHDGGGYGCRIPRYAFYFD